MQHALSAYYPRLRPRVDVNRVDVTCWNKDGHSDSLDRFLQDPTIRIEDCTRAAREPDWCHHCAAPTPLVARLGASSSARLAQLLGGAA
jgi:hypothetical protein